MGPQYSASSSKAKRKPTAPKETPAQARERAEWEVMFPHRSYPLLCGEDVLVESWDIDTGERLSELLTTVVEKIASTAIERGSNGAELRAVEVLKICRPEVTEIVRQTIGLSPEEFRAKVRWEDLLGLTQAVIEVCITREDGSGALPKLLALTQFAAQLMLGLEEARASAEA